jgi:osmotically-inducible protein OsmY
MHPIPTRHGLERVRYGIKVTAAPEISDPRNPLKGANVSTINTSTEDAVREVLTLDQRIPDPEQVAVSADAGTVTLRGTVGSFSQRRAAADDAQSVDGVDDVYDELKVRLLTESRREDADIRGMALQILMWDAEVPAELIDVNVDAGWVTLTGDVSFQFENDAAFEDVADMLGVVGVTNNIRVTTP